MITLARVGAVAVFVWCSGCTHSAARPAPRSAEAPAKHRGDMAPSPSADEEQSSELSAWRSFVVALRSGRLGAGDLRPYRQEWGPRLLAMLTGLAQRTTVKAAWSEWDARPEIHRDGDLAHFLVGLSIETEDGKPHPYSFTFVRENGAWFFCNLESILLRLDKIAPPPTADFPEAPEERKAWMRTEQAVSERVRLFNFLAREKGRDAAFEWFKDGPGYATMAKTWVPFVPRARAFVLFACWEQAKLKGNAVMLERLDEHEAIVRIRSDELLVYERATHLAPLITRDDYRGLIKTIWQDRAEKSGWQASVSFGDEGSIELHLRQ